MGVITTGQTFASGDQVTATKLNDIANNCTFTSAADTTDNSTLTLGSSKLKVKDAGITSTQLATDSVITAKIQDGAVTAAKLAQAAINAIMPTGAVVPFAGAGTALPGNAGDWLLCDGSPIDRQVASVNTALFDVLGTQYGHGNGTSTYNLPDLRGRVIAGQDNMGGASANRLTTAKSGINGDNLGAFGGLEDHQLTIAEMPAHDHTYNRTNNVTAGGSMAIEDGPVTGTATSSLTGGGGSHNNVQPTIILNYIIKT